MLPEPTWAEHAKTYCRCHPILYWKSRGVQTRRTLGDHFSIFKILVNYILRICCSWAPGLPKRVSGKNASRHFEFLKSNCQLFTKNGPHHCVIPNGNKHLTQHQQDTGLPHQTSCATMPSPFLNGRSHIPNLPNAPAAHCFVIELGIPEPPKQKRTRRTTSSATGTRAWSQDVTKLPGVTVLRFGQATNQILNSVTQKQNNSAHQLGTALGRAKRSTAGGCFALRLAPAARRERATHFPFENANVVKFDNVMGMKRNADSAALLGSPTLGPQHILK